MTWKFVDTVDCYLIGGELLSGTEVYSCFHSTKKEIPPEVFVDEWFSCNENGDFSKTGV